MIFRKIITIICFGLSGPMSIAFGQSDNAAHENASAGDTYCTLSKRLANSEPQKALAYAQQALKFYAGYGDVSSRSKALFLMGVAYKHLGNFDSSLYCYNLCYKERVQEKAEPMLIAEALNGIGIIYSQQGNFSGGLSYFMQAQEIFDRSGDSGKIAKGYNNIGNIYYSLNQVDKCLPYYKKSLAIKEKLNDVEAISAGLTNLASVYIAQRQFDSAKSYLDKSLILDTENNDRRNVSIDYMRQAYLCTETKQYESCLGYLRKAFAISEELKDEYGIMSALSDIGSCYYDMGDNKNAITFSKQALSYAKRIGSKSQLCDLTEILGYSYYGLGDYKTAYNYIFDHINHYTAMLRQENTDKVAELQQKYEVAQKEKKLEQLNMEKMNREVELLRKKSQLNYILAAGTIIIFLISLVYYRYSLKQKNRLITQEAELSRERIRAVEEKRALQEKQQNELLHVIINVQEEERRKIAVDIHDGLGQLLSGIKMNLQLALSDNNIPAQTEQALKNILELNNESITESRSIASDLLPYNIKDFGLVTAIKNLCYKNNQLKISNITFYSNDVPRKLPAELEITLYRIAQELINNALKHAKAGEIFVQLFFRENKLILQI
ncbi:MAG: tetratricopeptide repeat-containing sensor histidine kinase, partial [Bacteroidia bacterium]